MCSSVYVTLGEFTLIKCGVIAVLLVVVVVVVVVSVEGAMVINVLFWVGHCSVDSLCGGYESKREDLQTSEKSLRPCFLFHAFINFTVLKKLNRVFQEKKRRFRRSKGF